MTHRISPAPLRLDDLQNILDKNLPLALSDEAYHRLARCRSFLEDMLRKEDAIFYGVNTGFGSLRNVRISDTDLEQLQLNLVMSHACGTGEEVPADIVRLMLLLKIQNLAYGHSGVLPETVQRLIDFFNAGILPVVYQQGSLGASGDLAPLAHLTLPLLGKGEVYWRGSRMPAAEALKQAGWQPLTLRSKEGLALLNGTQFMSAYGVFLLLQARRCSVLADLIAAVSLDAFACSADPFLLELHQLRPHHGQLATAAFIQQVLCDSPLFAQPKTDIQDPYSFRCIPQVHGASKDVFAYCERVFTTEINSVSDNPIVLPDNGRILSGGNFHGQPLALALDFLAMALAELGSISERRTFLLLSGQRGLPAYLVAQPGLNSGLMIAQYTAAALVSENKQLCTPASVDSITSSNGQEDHVSMGANAATQCYRVWQNLEKILAVELLCAAQALEFRRPARSSSLVEQFVSDFRQLVPFNVADRELHNDLNNAVRFLRSFRRHNPTL
ncbi:MAG: histidine ammonia-lyase [Chitinophagales bacterium]|nr:histidine ammonia-lyase [Chitinophagales bacterium]MDW8393887.1 histidine ammonia-lyase [Chitinophagales bacterium]